MYRRAMLVLRADPWQPSFGMGFEAGELDEEAQEMADPTVESDDWTTPLTPEPGAGWSGPIAFVDGVERVELGLIAEDEGATAPGLFGSFAVGTALCNGSSGFSQPRVGRALVTGGGLRAKATELTIGACTLRFEPASDPDAAPHRPRLHLMSLMRRAEAALAREAAAGGATLVLADGRLQFPDESGLPVVGFVKRFMKHHLPAEHGRLLGWLGPGQRTPLFCLSGSDAIQRYSWYVRLVPQRVHWHGLAGLVRCEVSAGIGRDDAIRLADRVTAVLPRYAGSPADPRTPQNLGPVARLETQLRRMMGDARLIRRELTSWLIRGGGTA